MQVGEKKGTPALLFVDLLQEFHPLSCVIQVMRHRAADVPYYHSEWLFCSRKANFVLVNLNKPVSHGIVFFVIVTTATARYLSQKK